MNLIDRDKIPYREYLGNDEPLVYKSEIDAMPTVDAVPVRCKDCRHGRLDKAQSSPEWGWRYACVVNENAWKSGDGFCSSGERRCE